VTFVAAITVLSERFLTERSFELIVTPALADFEFDSGTSGPRRLAPYLAVIAALLGAFRDDAVRGGDIVTFAGLVLIPVCYYSFFFVLGLPQGMGSMPTSMIAALGVGVVALSLAPVIVCYWPERQPRNPSTEP
jgi:hypothetical protein